jgi:recombination protein RecT
MTEIVKKESQALAFIKSPAFKARIEEVLKQKAPQFVASSLTLVSSDSKLSMCSGNSVFTALVTAAALDLPVDKNLGFAYLIPYGQDCSFQVGYKGFIQLAMRSGQFKNISVTEIYDGQIVSKNPLTGYIFDFEKEVEKTEKNIIGYASYFSLINGFEKTFYMSYEDLKKHGVKFSQTFKKGFGLWKDDFNSMAKKTVLKLLLSRFAPLSTEMQKSITLDQSVVREDETPDYIDVPTEEPENEEKKRILAFISGVKTKEGLEGVRAEAMAMDEEVEIAFLEKMNTFEESK